MNILLVAATAREMVNYKGPHKVLLTGPGMIATTLCLTEELSQYSYDLVLNAGVAGAFDRSLSLCQAVEVVDDTFAELGAQDGDEFLSMEEIGLAVQSHFQVPAQTTLQQVKSITVNTVHGNEPDILRVLQRLSPQVETMEGAACLKVCAYFKVSCVQIRTISNYVERRNKAAWNLPLAIANLPKAIHQFTSSL